MAQQNLRGRQRLFPRLAVNPAKAKRENQPALAVVAKKPKLQSSG